MKGKSGLFILALGLPLGVILSASLLLAADETLPKPKVLNEETIYATKRLSTYDNLIIKDFPIDKAEVSNISDGDMPRYKALKPKLVNMLSDEVVRQLRAKKLFKKVQRNGQTGGKTIIMEGRFTEVNAGSRAAKFWVGYGAGSSKIAVKGRLLDAATGKELAVFENSRHSPMSMEDFDRILTRDTKNLGVDFGKFLEKLY